MRPVECAGITPSDVASACLLVMTGQRKQSGLVIDEQQPSVTDTLLCALRDRVDDAIAAIREGSMERLACAMGHEYEAKMDALPGLCSPLMQQCVDLVARIRATSSAHNVHIRGLGSGGGGFMLVCAGGVQGSAMLPSLRTELEALVCPHGGYVCAVQPSPSGVSLEVVRMKQIEI